MESLFFSGYSILMRKMTRSLSIHEYMSMEILKDAGVRVPHGRVASSPEEAVSVTKSIGTSDFVIKAQVLAGGRGKGEFTSGLKGGVHLAYGPEMLADYAKKMLGTRLVTKQTGQKGLPCNKVYIVERMYPRREFYLAITLDRNSQGPVIIGSGRGGVNIEEVAAQDPSAIVTQVVDLEKGISVEMARKFMTQIGISKTCVEAAAAELCKLYQLFIQKDCSMVEINPFCETNSGEMVSMDCKIKFDDNALCRHPDLQSLRDFSQEDPREVLACKSDLNYIGLDGQIGCLVNGAGLAMATMDIIKYHGGSPANFLDLGGAASSQHVIDALSIIHQDPQVRAIWINIFGGIMRCDVIAEGIIQAITKQNSKIPVVVRLQGTRRIEAMMMLSQSGLRILPIDNFEDAAKTTVALSQICEIASKTAVNVNFDMLI